MILVLGRFQPLHNGHMKVFRHAIEQDPELVIAIGSASKHDEPLNPFSGEERKEMINRALKSEDLNATVVLIPNVSSDTHYVKHVEEQIGHAPDKIITENQWSIDLFTHAGYKVIIPARHFELSSTDIRKRMTADQTWEDLVPTEVYRYIKEIKGDDRIKKLST